MGNAGSTPLHKAANEKDFRKVQQEVTKKPGTVNQQEGQVGARPGWAWRNSHTAITKVSVLQLHCLFSFCSLCIVSLSTPGHAAALIDLVRWFSTWP